MFKKIIEIEKLTVYTNIRRTNRVNLAMGNWQKQVFLKNLIVRLLGTATEAIKMA